MVESFKIGLTRTQCRHVTDGWTDRQKDMLPSERLRYAMRRAGKHKADCKWILTNDYICQVHEAHECVIKLNLMTQPTHCRAFTG